MVVACVEITQSACQNCAAWWVSPIKSNNRLSWIYTRLMHNLPDWCDSVCDLLDLYLAQMMQF